MNRLCFVVCCLLFPLVCAGAQYRAGERTYNPDNQFPHWEIGTAWEGSSSEVSLLNGQLSSDGLHGVSGRLLYYPYPATAVGIEGTYFGKQSLVPFVTSYRVHRFGILGKLHLSAQTNPRIYLVAGAGQTSHQLKYKSPFEGLNHTKHIFYVTGGIGTEISVYRCAFVLLEGRMIYNKATMLSHFYTFTKRWEGNVRLGVGARF